MSISLPTCFLHIGMPKTGTSSIQESLGNANLDNWGTYCKVTKSHNQTGAFCTMFLSKPEKFHANVKRSLSLEEITTIRKDYRLSLQDILKKSCKKNLIISAEGLFHVDKDGLDDLLNFISEFYKKVIVICYIRPPASYLSSSFQQTLKSRDVFTLDLEREYPFYRKKLAKFEAVFGKDAINYILFDKKTLKNADVVQDICATIGIDYALINARHTNESLSREASSLLFTYRKQGGLFGTGKEAMLKNKLMIEKLGELRGSKLTFCSDLIQPILNKNADDIAWMQKRLTQHSLLNEKPIIGKDSDECITSENDLMKLPNSTITWLKQQIKICDESKEANPKQIAEWMQTLQDQLLDGYKKNKRLMQTLKNRGLS